MQDKFISIDTRNREVKPVPRTSADDSVENDSPATTLEISDVSESPQLNAIAPDITGDFHNFAQIEFLDDALPSHLEHFATEDEGASEEGSVLLRWGTKMDSLVGVSIYESSESVGPIGPVGGSARPKDDQFVKQLLTAIQFKSMDNLSFLFTSFEDLDQSQTSTVCCMLRSVSLFDELSKLLLSQIDFNDVKYTPLCRFLYKCFASECSYQRKFAIRFLPSIIWLFWTRELKSLGEIISILHALFLVEKVTHGKPVDSPKATKDGVDRSHNLFPTTRFPDFSTFKCCIYNHDQSDALSDDDLLTDAEIDNLMSPNPSEAGANNFPNVLDTVESLPNCFPLVLVSLRLYAHYIDRIPLHTLENPHSLQQLCAVVGRLCSPDAPLPAMDWQWDWENPKTGKITVNAFFPEEILNDMLQILRFCLNFPQTKDIAFWALAQFHLYVSTCLKPSLILQSMCLLEHDYVRNGDRIFGSKEVKSPKFEPMERPPAPQRTPSFFPKVQAQFKQQFGPESILMKKLSSIVNVHPKKQKSESTNSTRVSL